MIPWNLRSISLVSSPRKLLNHKKIKFCYRKKYFRTQSKKHHFFWFEPDTLEWSTFLSRFSWDVGLRPFCFEKIEKTIWNIKHFCPKNFLIFFFKNFNFFIPNLFIFFSTVKSDRDMIFWSLVEFRSCRIYIHIYMAKSSWLHFFLFFFENFKFFWFQTIVFLL